MKVALPAGDPSNAWRLFMFNWAVLAGIWLALVAMLLLGGFSLTPRSVWIGWGFVTVYGGFALYNAKAARRGDPQVVFVLGGFAQIVLITLLMTPFTYVAAATNLPMQDALLLEVDRSLGLDWHGYIRFLHDHPTLAGWINYGYRLIKWPLFIIPVALAATHRFTRLQHYTLAFVVGLIITTAVSVFVPALGVYHVLGLSIRDFPLFMPGAFESQLRDLPLVRDGSLRVLDLANMTGLVTFPSFHAASAAIYVWALWPVKLLRPVAILANALMLAATPVIGGHYFVDVFAGIAVAAVSIVIAGRICRRIVAIPADKAATGLGVAEPPSRLTA
jgi:hypothetical protein